MAESGTTSIIFGQKLGNDIVKIVVGPRGSSKEFTIHKDLLCEAVPYFKAMFTGGFSEATTQSATLPENDPAAFELFLGWIYRGVIDEARFYDHLISLFGLAEKYDLVALMDKTMDTIASRLYSDNLVFGPAQLEYIYSRTCEQSELRLFAARMYAWRILVQPDIGAAETATMLPKGPHLNDILIDSQKLMRNLKPKGPNHIIFFDPRTAPPCHYHQHGKSEKCPYKVGALLSK